MSIKINKEEFTILETASIRRQLKKIILDYANEIEEIDPELSQKIQAQDEEFALLSFQKIYNLTPDRFYQRALLALHVETEINIFEHDEFSFILNHRFLNGTAKARHILLSVTNILKAA